jgi:Holliday junction resolvasome RuvABC endonuclease subunit
MVIAGLDPSFSNFGFSKGTFINGYLEITQVSLQKTEKSKVKQVKVNSDDLYRATLLLKSINDFLSGVDLVFIEVPQGSQSASAAKAYGVCIGLIAGIKIPYIQVNPTQVKIAATGNKTASKAEMINWAVDMYPELNWLTKKQKGLVSLTNDNEHIADSIAAIHAGLRSDTFKQLQAFQRTIS